MPARETTTFERKEKVSRTFLKTVSAYANYATGQIVFGINDEGVVVGLEDPIDTCSRIANMINDSIDPAPRYRLTPDAKTSTVTLTVFEGPNKPYLASGKAYRRSDSATVEVDRLEYGRLMLEGSNQTYDELPAERQDLEFDVLEKRLQDKLGIEELDNDIMKTLELLTVRDGYTNAAAILADSNSFKGVDVVRFGDNINKLMDRRTLEGVSAIAQLEGAVEMFCTYYLFEQIDGSERSVVELVPEEAFREAVANAIVHRTWDVPANITISMFPDRIEIASPGSLPSGLTVDEYLGGHISLLRNPILANVFFRLRYIEKFGTGVLRINEAYSGFTRKPSFTLREESIMVTLPIVNGIHMSEDEKAIVAVIPQGIELPRSEIASKAGFSKDKTIRILNALLNKGSLTKQGDGRSTRYSRA